LQIPEIKYAKNRDVRIAYSVVRNGPIDLILTPGLVTHLDFYFKYPPMLGCFQKLSSFARLIVFDKRGTGLSDRAVGTSTFEERVDDIRAVMDDIGSEKAVLFGLSDGATMSMLHAAIHPERTLGLIVYGGEARGAWAPDYPWEIKKEEYEKGIASAKENWGSNESVERGIKSLAPSRIGDPEFAQWLGGMLRAGASFSDAIDILEVNMDMDVRQILSSIHIPTLVIHLTEDRNVRVENGRFIAHHIIGARLVELPGTDHFFFVDEVLTDRILRVTREFIDGLPPTGDADRVLATIMFFDLVSSTTKASQLGDALWREKMNRMFTKIRSELVRFGGREIKTMGDGFLATFDGPTRAIRCASSIRNQVNRDGMEARIGLHAGECTFSGEDIQGIAVHIGSRVMQKAEANEILVSSTLKDLVVGSGIIFEDRGYRSLKGLPERWRLFSVPAPKVSSDYNRLQLKS